MNDMLKIVFERVFDQLVEADEPDLSAKEAAIHTAKFMESHYDQTKLDSRYGYTPEEALRFQVEDYLEDTFGIEDERRGA